MQRFKKIGVFLHDSPSDDGALAFAARFASLAQSESVHCVHVHENGSSDTPEPEPAQFEAKVRSQLPDEIARKTTVQLSAGSGVSEILRCARDQELDLVCVGRRLPSAQLGIGSSFARLARKSPCNVLVVPHHVSPHMSRLIVPVDFSDHAKLAVEQAIAIAHASGKERAEILVHSVVSVGYGYQKLGLSLHEAGTQLEVKTRERLNKFVAGFDTKGVKLDTISTCSETVEQSIHDLATVRKMDMIVVGSRGQTTSAAVLLGGTAEKIMLGSPLPTLVVKNKGETVSLLNALLDD